MGGFFYKKLNMKITTIIASTTHIDRHGERMAKSALDGMAEQINLKYIPLTVNHDRSKQIGVLLYGRVVPYDSGEFALLVVASQFEKETERSIYQVGKTNTVCQEYTSYLDGITILEDHSSFLQDEPRKNKNTADLLEIHLDSTKIDSSGQAYKIKELVASTGDLKVEVYPKDHFPPHFHVVSRQRGINARFDLETLDVLHVKKGKLRQKDIKKIKHFFEVYPHELDKLRKIHEKMSQE